MHMLPEPDPEFEEPEPPLVLLPPVEPPLEPLDEPLEEPPLEEVSWPGAELGANVWPASLDEVAPAVSDDVGPEALESSGPQAVRDSPAATATRAMTESLLLLRIATP
ncbi:hypothetical protein [Streptomyces sp. NPDC087270]|uniref:hypothetical protein n=1 Tax=Streptomyces sp. NPDC087270 TaxID=3365774 RepID=UPI00381FC193